MKANTYIISFILLLITSTLLGFIGLDNSKHKKVESNFCDYKRNLSDFSAYRFPSEIEDLKKSETTAGFYQSLGANFYNWVGEYQKAMELWSKNIKEPESLGQEERDFFLSFRPVDASDYIINRSINENIIIINEAHDKPQHRVFTTSILKELYKNGFRSLFIEALSREDSLINKRGYPVSNTGLYVKDPQFGNMVRQALELGFKLYPYESVMHNTNKERELNQAQNIASILERNKINKALVYCGYDHAMENLETESHGKLMANHLKTITGINPFTVSQYQLTEAFNKKSSPYMDLVNVNQPSIFVNDSGETFSGPKGVKHCDMWLFHPYTKEANDRPNWLNWPENKDWVKIPDLDIDSFMYPTMLLIFDKNEYSSNAIPVDAIILNNEDDYKKKRLSLYAKKSYTAIFIDSNNNCEKLDFNTG